MRNSLIIIGILLVCFGLFGLVYEYFPYKTETNVAVLGPLHVETQRSKYIFIPPLLSGLSITAGIIFLAFAGRNKSS